MRWEENPEQLRYFGKLYILASVSFPSASFYLVLKAAAKKRNTAMNWVYFSIRHGCRFTRSMNTLRNTIVPFSTD